jgi:hypothetical protein
MIGKSGKVIVYQVHIPAAHVTRTSHAIFADIDFPCRVRNLVNLLHNFVSTLLFIEFGPAVVTYLGVIRPVEPDQFFLLLSDLAAVGRVGLPENLLSGRKVA